MGIDLNWLAAGLFLSAPLLLTGNLSFGLGVAAIFGGIALVRANRAGHPSSAESSQLEFLEGAQEQGRQLGSGAAGLKALASLAVHPLVTASESPFYAMLPSPDNSTRYVMARLWLAFSAILQQGNTQELRTAISELLTEVINTGVDEPSRAEFNSTILQSFAQLDQVRTALPPKGVPGVDKMGWRAAALWILKDFRAADGTTHAGLEKYQAATGSPNHGLTEADQQKLFEELMLNELFMVKFAQGAREGGSYPSDSEPIDRPVFVAQELLKGRIESGLPDEAKDLFS